MNSLDVLRTAADRVADLIQRNEELEARVTELEADLAAHRAATLAAEHERQEYQDRYNQEAEYAGTLLARIAALEGDA